MFESLFEPLHVGRITLPNRICFSAHRTNFAKAGRVTDRLIAYYLRRARGECGLISVGEFSILPDDRPWESMIEAYRPDAVQDFLKLTNALHQWDLPVLAHLNHHGLQSSGAISRRAVLGPSAIADIAFGETAKPMEPEDMEGVIQAFSSAAKRAREGGFDGLVIDMGPESLLRQFLSPITNHRQDEYGGSLDNRKRFPLEVIEGVRRSVGDDFTIGIGLCMDEQFWGGITAEESLEFAKHFEETGSVDFIQVHVGTYYNLHVVRASMHIPLGATIDLGGQLKDRISLPVLIGHQVGTPQLAARAIEENRADAVGFVRALISDPDMPRKARRVRSVNGRAEEIRYCVRDNKGCIGRVNQSKMLGCIQNPEVGYEALEADPPLKPAQESKGPKRVIVVGAGPAGLEAARSAAEGGHEVTLYERASQIGGQTNLHQITAGREPVMNVVHYLHRVLESMEIPIITGREVTADFVLREKPDAVVIATGSMPMVHPYPGSYGPPQVQTVWDVLQETYPVGNRILFIDEIGGHYSTATVEWLADRGKQIDMVSVDLFVGFELAALGDLYLTRQRLLQKGVTFQTDMIIDEVQGTHVSARNMYDNTPVRFHNHDTLILAAGNRVEDRLYKELKGKVAELYRAGDCVAPRGIDMAVFEGRKVGEGL